MKIKEAAPSNKLFYVLMLFGIVAAFSLSNAGEGPGPKSPMLQPPPGESLMMVNLVELRSLMNEIKIDNAVSAKIIAIARKFLNGLDEKIIRIQREELNIKEELLKEHPDLAAIQSAIERKTKVFGEIEISQIKRDLDIKSLLTADEYEMLKSAMRMKMGPMGGAPENRPWPDHNPGQRKGSEN